jgi:predicted peptidase
MRKEILFSLAVLGLLFFYEPTSADDVQTEQKIEATVPVKLQYLLGLPDDYDKQEKWPLLLFLHGRGESGENLDLVKIHGPPKLISQGKKFPFIVVSPQCPKEVWWNPHELVALLDEVSAKYKVDQDRICVTGLSLGGFGSWNLAFYAPDRIAAIAPICGGGEKYWAKRMAHIPVWAFHGAKDTGVPPERSQLMIDAIKKQGGSPKLTIYPNAGHNAWDETYNNPELYEWFLKQRRKPKK